MIPFKEKGSHLIGLEWSQSAFLTSSIQAHLNAVKNSAFSYVFPLCLFI